MMEKKMKNLFEKEEWVILNLHNMSFQVKQYLKRIEIIRPSVTGTEHLEKLNSFESIFNFYKDDLIPALKESAKLEEKHIEIFEKNPDKEFKPMQSEIEYHQGIIQKFIARFQSIHQEFYQFVHSRKE